MKSYLHYQKKIDEVKGDNESLDEVDNNNNDNDNRDNKDDAYDKDGDDMTLIVTIIRLII